MNSKGRLLQTKNKHTHTDIWQQLNVNGDMKKKNQVSKLDVQTQWTSISYFLTPMLELKMNELNALEIKRKNLNRDTLQSNSPKHYIVYVSIYITICLYRV